MLARNFANPFCYLLLTQFEELFISKIYESLHAHTPCLHTAFVIELHTKSFVQLNPAPVVHSKSNKSLDIQISVTDFAKRYSLAMHIELSGVGEYYWSHRQVICERQNACGIQLRSLSHLSPIFTVPSCVLSEKNGIETKYAIKI